MSSKRGMNLVSKIISSPLRSPAPFPYPELLYQAQWLGCPWRKPWNMIISFVSQQPSVSPFLTTRGRENTEDKNQHGCFIQQVKSSLSSPTACSIVYRLYLHQQHVQLFTIFIFTTDSMFNCLPSLSSQTACSIIHHIYLHHSIVYRHVLWLFRGEVEHHLHLELLQYIKL